MKILVIGYYKRKNLGDDVFKLVFENYFKTFVLRNPFFKSCICEISNIDNVIEIPNDISLVVFGGGDLINDYFITRMKDLMRNKQIPIYAIGIGIAYPSCVENGYLDMFDYIISRSSKDEEICKVRFGDRYSFAPDLSTLYPLYNIPTPYILNSRYNSKKIGVFLSRTIYNSKDPKSYADLCNTLALFLKFILEKEKKAFSIHRGFYRIPEYEVYLVPFCTEDKIDHDDRLINNDIYNRLHKYDNLHRINFVPLNNIIGVFNNFDFTICTRFHAHMFSILSEVPFLSIYTTRKVDNLIDKVYENTNYSIKMKTDDKDFPISLDLSECISKFTALEKNKCHVKSILKNTNIKYQKGVKLFIRRFDNLLFELPIFNKDIIVKQKLNRISNILFSKTDSYLMDEKSDILTLIKYNNGAIERYFKGFSQEEKEYIIQTVSYILTSERNSSYNYGLGLQIFQPDFNLCESVKWIYEHLNTNCSQKENNNLENIDTGISFLQNINNKIDKKFRKINIQNDNVYKGYHRSGWDYVIKSLKKLHNPNGIIFDSYLDKTFGWDNKFLEFINVVPYLQPWIGVFHHTNKPDYSEFDLSRAIENENFKLSLPYCKGIIVLSESNKQYLSEKLKIEIPILKVFHPTELTGFDFFDYKKFARTPLKNIVQIGAWLRNTYAIYKLNVPEDYIKLALKGKNMNNYFLNESEFEKIEDCINGEENYGDQNVSGCIVKGNYTNKYLSGLLNSIRKEHDSVGLLTDLDNVSYDILLKNCIVFLNLVDAAAVNTIIECIVRNTPIIVNRLPATEEYLGKDYPLFYDKIEDVHCILSDIKNIKNGYKYLKKMDKNRFSVDYFLSSLINSEMYKSL